MTASCGYRKARGAEFRMKPGGILLFLALFVAVWGSCFAAEKVSITAEKRLGYDLGKNALSLEGNVRITQGETLIMGERAEIDTDKKIARITGGVMLTQPDTVLRCASLVVYLNERRVVADGDVVLEKDEKQSSEGGASKEVRKERVTLRCLHLEYWTSRKEARASGNISVVKGKTRAWSSEAVYSEKNKVLTLTGNVRVERDSGEKLTCGELAFYTDRELVEARSSVSVEFEIEEEKEGAQG